MMDATQALEAFLAGTLARRKERYLGFIASSKNQAKFLAAIHHDLERELDDACRIEKLPSTASPIAGYRYSPPSEFGTPVGDLRNVLKSTEDSFLVVSEDGRFGIHGPEAYLDARTIYRAK